MTRKTVEISITNEQAQNLFNSLINLNGNEFAGRWFNGSLVDEFAIGVNSNDWQFKAVKGRPILGRKYVYAREEYVNCWTSKLVLVLTDNDKKIKNFIESRFKNDESLNAVDLEDFLFDCGLND